MTRASAYHKSYLSRLKTKLYRDHGDICEVALCFETSALQFAHIKSTGLCGRSRGSAHRFLDVQRYPDNYRLVCRHHHLGMDRNGSVWEEVRWSSVW